ncbi:ER membrane complex subunit 7-like protein [Nymphaea thermarum]|nr:ER membrane complex subunit 7-like protein [Nymphaea thermarum]
MPEVQIKGDAFADETEDPTPQPDPCRSSRPHGNRRSASDREMEASVLLVSLAIFAQFVAPSLAVPSGNGDGYTINGQVKIQGAQSISLLGKISNVKVILNGGEKVTFVRPDGFFSLYPFLCSVRQCFLMILVMWFCDGIPNSHGVPAGTHLIEVAALGYFFSPVRVDISARNPGKVQATLTETRRSLNELVLEPLREEYYYEKREPFSILSLLKSPMGLMVGFMLVAVFLLPKLMENLDPEEMQRAQEQMRSQGVPSLSNLLPRN